LLVAVPDSDALEISDCLLTFIFPDPPRCLECAVLVVCRVRFAQFGETALHRAVLNGHHSIVGMLLAADADTNSKSKVSDALIPLLPPPPSTVVPLTHRRQASRKQQFNSRQLMCVRCVWSSGVTSLCSARNMIISCVEMRLFCDTVACDPHALSASSEPFHFSTS
jgi:hypothetical protein